jgi:pimeloyl-ACP methyl ester carboxylesterase
VIEEKYKSNARHFLSREVSGDAILTLMSPTDGPTVLPGDELNLDPELGMSGIKAIGKMTQLVVEPAISGDPIPTIQGLATLSGRYFESEADGFNIAESSVFPYYWDGTHWTVMQVRPHEIAVDEINNRHVAVLNFSTTETGNPVTAELGLKNPVLLASLDDYVPNLDIALIYLFSPGGAIIEDFIEPNGYIYDKDKLSAVPTDPNNDKYPSPNALPLLMIHGWDLKSVVKNQGKTDPNTHKRYRYIVEDIVTAFNGIYRPMFATHNPRAGMIQIGNDLANLYEDLDLKGLPPGTGNTGQFPYFDTFGYSMGGLVSRCLQSSHGGVHNMVIVGTPNHGTHSVLGYFDYIPIVGDLKRIVESWSPGTGDLYPYDDEAWFALFSGNPTLYGLNRSPTCMPRADMTLIAGTDGVLNSPYLMGENDKVVPVDSVFCRTSNPDDGDNSLLAVNPSANKYEYTAPFDHSNFGGENYKINDHPEVKGPIVQGFSDWTVGKLIDSNVIKFDDNYTVHYAEFSIKLEYNVMKRDTDRVALVIYAQDGNFNWHVCGLYADAAGNILYSDPINGNTADENVVSPTLSTVRLFTEDEGIWRIVFAVVPLKPGQTTVSLVPDADFALPGG